MSVAHKLVRLERMSDYRGVGLERLHCIYIWCDIYNLLLAILIQGIIENV